MLPSSRLRRSVRLAGVRLSAVTLASAALLLLLVAFSAFLLSAVGGLRETGTYASTRRNVAGTGDIFIFDTAAAWRSLRVPKCGKHSVCRPPLSCRPPGLPPPATPAAPARLLPAYPFPAAPAASPVSRHRGFHF